MEIWARLRHQTPPASWQRIGKEDIAGGSAEAKITWTPPGVGDYEIYLGVFDLAGESHAEQPVGQRYQYAYVTVESPQPIPKAVKLPASVEVNSTVAIAASAFDPDGNLKEMDLYYRFNKGPLTLINDSPIPASGFYATAKVEWTPLKMGVYTIQASVEDHDGYHNDSSLGGAKYVTETVNVVQASPSQGDAIASGFEGQLSGAKGQSGGSAPRLLSVRTTEKVYLNEYNRMWAVLDDSDGDLDEVQFQSRYKASAATQWGEWKDIGSAVAVSGRRVTVNSKWKPTLTGDYNIRATVTDEANNRATRESTRSFELRMGSPLVLSFTKPGTIYSQEPNALTAKVKDATDNLDDVQFQYDGPGSGTSWLDIGSAVEATSKHHFTAKINWTPTKTGSHKIKVIATDTSDNESPSYETASFTVVSGAPSVVSLPTPSGVQNGVSKTLSATVKDPSGNLKEAQFQYKGPSDTNWQNIGSAVPVTGGPGANVTAAKAWIPSAVGSFKIKVVVKDQSNNTGSAETSNFTVVEPPTAPVVSFLFVPSTVYDCEENTIWAIVTDVNGDLKEAQFQYDGPSSGTNWVDIGSTISVSGYSDTATTSWMPTWTGSYKIRATVSDHSTSTSDGISITPTFTVVSGTPEVSAITIPSKVYFNQANTLSATVKDPSGNLDEVEFEYDGPAPGTTWVDIGSAVSVSGSSDTASISWTPTLLGTYKIRVTATDEANNTDTGRSNSLTVECSPVLTN